MRSFRNTPLRAGCLAALIVLLASASAHARKWTTNQGRTINGNFVRVFQGNVVIKVGTRTTTVPFDSLSAEDQEYLRQELEAKGKGDLLPPPGTGGRSGGTQGKGLGQNADPGDRDDNRTGAAAGGAGMSGRMPSGYPRASTPSGYSGGATPSGYPRASTPSGYPGASTPSGYPGGSAPSGYPSSSGQGSMPSGYPGSSGPGSMSSPSGGAVPSGGGPPPVSPFEASGPSIPIPMGPQMVEAKLCLNCKKEVSASTKGGDRCPHCGVYFAYEQNADGTKTYTPGGRLRFGLFGGAIMGGAIAAVIAILVKVLKGSQ